MRTRAELTGRRKLMSWFFWMMVIMGLPLIQATGPDIRIWGRGGLAVWALIWVGFARVAHCRNSSTIASSTIASKEVRWGRIGLTFQSFRI